MPITYYIAPDGDDQHPGSERQPFATLEAARDAIRALKATTTQQEPVRVYLRGGDYRLSQPFTLHADDSGVPEQRKGQGKKNPEFPITYAAYPGESPVLSGGRRISDWQISELNGKPVWLASLPEVKSGAWSFRQLWVNGERRYRPRLPKDGEFRVAQVLDAHFDGPFGETIAKGTNRFVFAPGDLRADWHNLQDVELSFYILWVSTRVNLLAVDEATGLATLDRNSGMRLTSDDDKRDGAPYIVENVFEALDTPGEWYLDRPQGVLYYLPKPGETPETTEVIAPYLEELLRLEGGPDDSDMVQCVTFDGITFAHTEWREPAAYARSAQASVAVPGAVTLRHARRCTLRDCTLTHLGTYAVNLAEACSDITVQGCAMTDLGAGGVKIWHGCRRNIIADCEIADGGILYSSAVGVVIGNASGNQVVHNHIHDFFYSGVSVGWTWGYAESNTYGNLIEWNHIHHLGKGKLSDMGGIYTLGVQTGTRLRYNLIHDITSRAYGGWALYTDEGSSFILLEGNICYNTSKESFHQHYGRENLITNNIFAFAGEAQLLYTLAEQHVGFIFEQNIVISDGVPMWLDDYGDAQRQIVCDHNLYWDVAQPVPVVNQSGNCHIGLGDERRTLTEWQAQGFDRHGRAADPRCANLAARDFTLAADSPAWAIGFRPLDLSTVGPRER